MQVQERNLQVLTKMNRLRATLKSRIDRGPCSRLFGSMSTRDAMQEKLARAFAPLSLDVIDESHQHEGHAGHREGGETHFRVYIVSEAFRGKTRIERHRMVNETLAAELKGGVHALAIQALAPGEG
jgi:BolA family transcriptional regulator, general stress-responsive regulator